MKTPYTDTFYKGFIDTSLRSATHIVGLINGLVEPRSVVDVGCGTGTWLAACMSLGLDDVLGVDGSYINLDLLQIPREKFRAHNLSEQLDLERQFDLVMSLEVAEHLPSQSAERFVTTLTRLGPVVLFSAAIPFQGGTHHVNEQWPTYWADMFARHGYVAIDCIRPNIWMNQEVAFYYAQNTIVFVDEQKLAEYPRLQSEYAARGNMVLPLVHPRQWLQAQDPARQPFRKVFRAFPFAVKNALTAGFQRLTGK